MTLHKWRAEARGKGQLLPDANAGPEGGSPHDKFAAVVETTALNEADMANTAENAGFIRRRSRRGELHANGRMTGTAPARRVSDR